VERRARRPLFPGRSCFPLTPTSNTCFKDKSDQLNTIFAVLGTPNKEDVASLDAGDDVKSYLGKQIAHVDPIDLREKFPWADPQAVDLLDGLLKFLAAKRTDMVGALAHPYLSNVKSPAMQKRGAKTELAVTEQALMELSMQNKQMAELRGSTTAHDKAMDDDEAPAKLQQRSESLLAAKELLSLDYENRYDRRNHREAVEKLSAMFRNEIQGLHEQLKAAGH
jgi:serine/threonine protein kinase